MRVFLAGATGAVGSRLMPLLVSSGHSVIGQTRPEAKAAAIRAAGGEPVVVDGLDKARLRDAVVAARPEAVIHEMTALGAVDYRHFDRSLRRARAASSRKAIAAGPMRGPAAQ
ncbi:MAG TPA: NAD-dependent epimerase/dehydratase family protein [Stellaceae bacterium]|nr:NAD-dependent epimerase/dehydratase family protein [Stellaceae bacterium]